jgi:3-hydroxyacyl-CoA dehydrogenase
VAEALAAFGAALPGAVPPDRDTSLHPMPEAEVQNRWLAALANEGLKLIEAGIARRPSDIDHLLVAGHQFPRWRGGPMHQADQRGLMVLRRDLRLWAAEDAFWTPARVLDLLIAEGRRLPALDG